MCAALEAALAEATAEVAALRDKLQVGPSLSQRVRIRIPIRTRHTSA